MWPGTSGTSMCFHWESSRLPACVRAVGAPQHQGELADSLGWIWKGPPSEIQFWLPLISTPYPGNQHQGHQDDRADDDRVGERPVELDRHPGGREQQHAADEAAARSCLQKK